MCGWFSLDDLCRILRVIFLSPGLETSKQCLGGSGGGGARLLDLEDSNNNSKQDHCKEAQSGGQGLAQTPSPE